jgi:hypothetical protein
MSTLLLKEKIRGVKYIFKIHLYHIIILNWSKKNVMFDFALPLDYLITGGGIIFLYSVYWS